MTWNTPNYMLNMRNLDVASADIRPRLGVLASSLHRYAASWYVASFEVPNLVVYDHAADLDYVNELVGAITSVRSSIHCVCPIFH